MRAFILAILLLISQTAIADTPMAVTRCDGPGRCTTVYIIPCGTFIAIDRYDVTPGINALSTNSGFPRFEGVCGFYHPPYYSLAPSPEATNTKDIPSIVANPSNYLQVSPPPDSANAPLLLTYPSYYPGLYMKASPPEVPKSSDAPTMPTSPP